MNLPLLGICYGHQLIVNKFGGKVKRANKEYGSSLLTIDNDKNLLNGIGGSVRAWMSHGDEAEQIPPGFKVIGHTESAKAAAIASEEKSIYGIQFHPEVVHTEQGTKILKNFVLKVCGAKQDWTIIRRFNSSDNTEPPPPIEFGTSIGCSIINLLIASGNFDAITLSLVKGCGDEGVFGIDDK